MKASDLDNLITQAEAARLRGVSREAISDLVARGRLQSVEVAGTRLVRRSEVENFVEKRAGRPPKQAATTKQASKKGGKK